MGKSGFIFCGSWGQMVFELEFSLENCIYIFIYRFLSVVFERKLNCFKNFLVQIWEKVQIGVFKFSLYQNINIALQKYLPFPQFLTHKPEIFCTRCLKKARKPESGFAKARIGPGFRAFLKKRSGFRAGPRPGTALVCESDIPSVI